MLKIASKFAMDIFPSVIATIIGAYIVNHYIVSKPANSPTAAVVSPGSPKKADLKSDSKSADLGNTPEAGVRAKGISEKSVIDRSSADKAVFEKPADKAVDKPAETASIPSDTRRHPANSREKEKAVAKTAPVQTAPVQPAPLQPVVPVIEPVVATPNPAPPVEAAIAPDRDANDLARAAIERLRATTPDSSPRAPERAQETVRLPDTPAAPRVATAPVTPTGPAPSLQPLPPPIMVSAPPVETAPAKPSVSARGDDSQRPTPPADIPDPRPLDLRADAVADPPPPRTTVADDVLSAAKSMFHSVLPNNSAK
jgi:hypothetical protein